MLERRFGKILGFFIILLISLPFVYAFQSGNAESIFGGFLINPIDGHSYLAKMQQGFQGEWRFVLPFTAEPGQGAYLFLFYLGLGHIARVSHLPLIFVFHGFRIFGSVLLIWSLQKLFKNMFSERNDQNLALLMSVVGSGLGWVAILAGMFTSDFWVAEIYPFLSMYTNPHFALGLALLVFSLIPEDKSFHWKKIALGIVLGIVQPFAVVIGVLVLSGMVITGIKGKGSLIENTKSSSYFWSLLGLAIGGGLILIYQYWSILADPVLRYWNQQNVTSSPGLMDLLISLSPCLVLAGLGLKRAWREESGKMMVIWSLASLLLALMPWNLQRRFLTGIYVPLAGLSVFGIKEIAARKWISYRYTAISVLLLIIPTNFIIVFSGVQAAAVQDSKIYLDVNLANGLDWINKNTKPDSLILANSQTGLYIPSQTGRRVVYGHPFETIHAEEELKFLEEYFVKPKDTQYYKKQLEERNIDYLFLQRDYSKELREWIAQEDIILSYENEDVLIYSVDFP